MKKQATEAEIIRALEERLLDLNVRKNEKEVSSILADEFIEYGSSGRIYDKAQVIEGLQGETFVELSLSNFEIKFLSPEIALEDMAHFMVAQLNNGMYGGNSVISSQGMDRTHTPLMPGICNYGMGWAINNIDIVHNGAIQNFRADVFMRNGENGDKWGVAVLINSMDILTLELLGEVPYGNISYDIIQLLHGQKPSNNYSPFKITFSNIGKVAKIYLYLLLAALLFLTSSLRNILRLK